MHSRVDPEFQKWGSGRVSAGGQKWEMIKEQKKKDNKMKEIVNHSEKLYMLKSEKIELKLNINVYEINK